MTPSEANRISILVDDKPLLAINKPPGLLTQGPPSANTTLESLVRQDIKDRQNKPGRVYLGIPHRLDRAVTGAILFATNSKGAARLAEIFRDRRVKKTYWAILQDPPDPAEGVLIDHIKKIDDVACAEIVPAGTPGAQEARLSYQIIGAVPGGWLVNIQPDTGRFHQIRVQFGSRGWSVLGDLLYGARQALSPDEVGWIDDGSDSPITPIALHSRELVLPHPIRFDELNITAPVPDYWLKRGWVQESRAD